MPTDTPPPDTPPDSDARWMHRAIELSGRGWGRVHPNPLVGAVVVRGGEPVGEGWHGEHGAEHAEAAALRAAGERARGATLYVSLEPCNHLGKQPPCVDAIIAAGINRVVVAVGDPNPVAAGGIERLAAAGIKIDCGIEGAAAAFANFRFLHAYSQPERPFVAVKLAVSLDGCLADASGNSRWVSGPEARRWVHWLRAGFGGIAVGAQTAIADDARLTVRGEIEPRLPPVRIIFDRRGRMEPNHGILRDRSGVPVLIVVGSDVPVDRRQALADAGARILVADQLTDALRAIRAAGVDAVLVEGGGRLAGALLGADLVDRIYQVQSPLWLGDGKRAWEGLGRPAITEAPRWRLNHTRVLPDSGDVLLVLER